MKKNQNLQHEKSLLSGHSLFTTIWVFAFELAGYLTYIPMVGIRIITGLLILCHFYCAYLHSDNIKGMIRRHEAEPKGKHERMRTRIIGIILFGIAVIAMLIPSHNYLAKAIIVSAAVWGNLKPMDTAKLSV